MHASVLSGQVRSGRLNDAISIYKKFVLLALNEQTGFKGAILLCNPDSQQFIAIFLWETTVDMLAAEASAYLQAQLHKIKPLFMGSLVNEHYVVNILD